jgi:hypothetical protein
VYDWRTALYLLAILCSAGCAGLQGRDYQREGVRLMLWSAIFFGALTVSNVVLFIDAVVSPDVNLRLARQIPVAIGVLALVYGLISDVAWKELRNPREAPPPGRVAALERPPLPALHRQRETGQTTVVATTQAEFGPDRVFAAD